MASFETVWLGLQRSLHRNQEMTGWSRKKGGTSLRFRIHDVESRAITILPGRGLSRRISKGDFDKVFAFWNAYCKGELNRSEMASLSQNTSYIFSILHWQETTKQQ